MAKNIKQLEEEANRAIDRVLRPGVREFARGREVPERTEGMVAGMVGEAGLFFLRGRLSVRPSSSPGPPKTEKP